MGHLINPVTYRLGKTKFWNFVWSYKSKKNYKNFLIEDLNFHKFLKWLFSVLSWSKVGVFINEFNVIKNFGVTNVSLFFFINKLNLSNNYKKSLFKFFIRNNFINFFFSVLSNKTFSKSIKSNFFKSNKMGFSKKKGICLKKKKIFYKKRRIIKLFLRTGSNIKKKKKNQKKIWLNSFLFNYCFFSFRCKKKWKNKYLKIFNYYFLNKNFHFRIFSFLSKNFFDKKFVILQKNLSARSFNYNFFFRLLSFFLSFFLKKVFQHKNFIFNFFQKNNLLLNAKSIKKFIRFSMEKNRSRVTQVVKKVFRKTKRKYFILGLKIGFFGRYEKKLRNKSVWQVRGSLSPSNINTPITHKNFCILLKQGLCGVKVSLLSKLEKNEIFKKKTFINKAFAIK